MGGVQIFEGGSKSTSGYGPGGPNPLADLDRGVQICGGFKYAVTPAKTGFAKAVDIKPII